MNVDVSGVQDALKVFAREHADAIGEEFVRRARERAPRRTGALADGVEYQVNDGPAGPQVTVTCAEDYGRYQDEGTGVYGPLGVPIVPVTASVLAWDGQDGVVFAMSSRGSRPTHWWSDTIKEWADIVRSVAG